MEYFCVENAKKFVTVFDVDGHLIDTESLGYQAYYEVIKEYFIAKNNQKALERFEEKFAPENGGMNWFVKNMMGKSHGLVSKLIYEECICSFPEYLAKTEEENKEIIDTIRSLPSNKHYASFRYYTKQHYRRERAVFQEEFRHIREEVDRRVIARTDEKALLPGAKDMLVNLGKNKDIAVHFVSGSSRARLELIFKKVGLFDVIDFQHNVRGGEDFKYKTEALEQILRQEGYTPVGSVETRPLPVSHMIFSGDSVYDAMSSKQLGITGAFFVGNVGASHCSECYAEHANRLLDNGADTIITSISGLGRAIRERIKDVKEKDAMAVNMILNVGCRYMGAEHSIS
ncbi:MAG: HAD family hydrolase [Alphaproteobacteria bacterium]|nr:HAD family hydrolase [Alphaproteobacteria bacterium]